MLLSVAIMVYYGSLVDVLINVVYFAVVRPYNFLIRWKFGLFHSIWIQNKSYILQAVFSALQTGK